MCSAGLGHSEHMALLQPSKPVAPAVPTEVDVSVLRALLDGRYAAVRDQVRATIEQHADTLETVHDLTRDQYRDLVRDVIVESADTGAQAHGFPAAYGGGDDVGASIAAFETLAFSDLSVLVKSGVQFGLFGGAVLQLGTKRHHDAYLEDLIHARVLGCFAMSETGHGSNVQALATTATYDAETDELVVHSPTEYSGKDYIGNAARHGTVAAVFAQLHVGGENHGVHALLVPIRGEDGEPLPGVRIADDGPKIGLNGVDNGRLWFDQVRVPRDNLLDRYASIDEHGTYSSPIDNPDRRFFTMLGTLVQGRVCVGAGGLSAAKVALTIAIRYAELRRQFGSPGTDKEEVLLDYGLHQRRLLPLLARSYALHFAQEELSEELHRIAGGRTRGTEPSDKEQRALESRAAGTKALGTWHATTAIQESREACGGAGYLLSNRLGTLRADTDVFTTFEGDNHILLQLVAKGLLTDYSTNFEELDQFGVVRFVADLAVETVIERTAARKLLERVRDVLPGDDGGDPDKGLRDARYHLGMLRFREEHSLSGVARRLKRGIDAGYDAAEVFSRAQTHVIHAARAHMERVVLQAFVDKLDSLPDGPEKLALNALADLHALTVIEADRGWFMEHGRLSSERSKLITREIAQLCREVRPLAGQLTDAFGIPEVSLQAEMIDQARRSEQDQEAGPS
ncbi:acyl-CoA dehydrogenase [Nocardioides marmoraquaticus]